MHGRTGRGGGGGASPPSLFGKQSQSGNIRSTVGQYWLIIKKNGTNSVGGGGRQNNFSPENFFGTCRAKSGKSGKFVSAPLIFTFRYAHVLMIYTL